MTSEEVFPVFKSLYDDERKRTQELNDHAKNNLSLATLYSGFVIFVVEKFPPSSLCNKLLFAGTVLCMLAAFFLSLLATQIAGFEEPRRPRDMAAQFAESGYDVEDFFQWRIADFTVAAERNAGVNDGRAVKLTFARYFLLLGIALHALYFLFRIG